MDQGKFTDLSWDQNHESEVSPAFSPRPDTEDAPGNHSNDRNAAKAKAQAVSTSDDVDFAGVGTATLECTVTQPIKEGDGTKDAYVSYLVTTHTNFPSFAKPVTTVRRRFTDFVFLYKTLCKEYLQCAVPPLPDKHKMEYVRGDRFGPDFTQRRANSLNRFLTRISLHPTLRRANLLILFLESNDWNSIMRSRPQRSSTSSEQGTGVFDNFTDSVINAFTKVHKPDKRFIDVKDKSDKLDEDLSHIEKIVARVARREGDLEVDYKDLAEQFQKLVPLEPGIDQSVQAFAVSLEDTSSSMRTLKEHTDQDYLGSLRDMQAYSTAVKGLLKAREQRQLDFEQLTEYLIKSTSDRDTLASSHGASSLTGAGGFIRSKIEEVRGVDHEQSRRDRLRRLELRIEELTREVESAKKVTEMFDEEVVKEVEEFERIKRIELKTQLGAFAYSHVDFYGKTIETWEKYVKEMESLGAPIA